MLPFGCERDAMIEQVAAKKLSKIAVNTHLGATGISITSEAEKRGKP